MSKQVQKPSFIWECAIVEELHKRLKANDLLDKVNWSCGGGVGWSFQACKWVIWILGNTS